MTDEDLDKLETRLRAIWCPVTAESIALELAIEVRRSRTRIAELESVLQAAGDLIYQLDEEKTTPLYYRTRRRIDALIESIREAERRPKEESESCPE